jgi:hypothetical protein
MPLMTYQDARPWARAVKTRVASREMPPWFADPAFGRALKNNPTLTDAEIDTIVVGWMQDAARRRLTTAAAGVHARVAQLPEPPADVILEMRPRSTSRPRARCRSSRSGRRIHSRRTSS